MVLLGCSAGVLRQVRIAMPGCNHVARRVRGTMCNVCNWLRGQGTQACGVVRARQGRQAGGQTRTRCAAQKLYNANMHGHGHEWLCDSHCVMHSGSCECVQGPHCTRLHWTHLQATCTPAVCAGRCPAAHCCCCVCCACARLLLSRACAALSYA